MQTGVVSLVGKVDLVWRHDSKIGLEGLEILRMQRRRGVRER
jgi:hypothetical protein